MIDQPRSRYTKMLLHDFGPESDKTFRGAIIGLRVAPERVTIYTDPLEWFNSEDGTGEFGGPSEFHAVASFRRAARLSPNIVRLGRRIWDHLHATGQRVVPPRWQSKLHVWLRRDDHRMADFTESVRYWANHDPRGTIAGVCASARSGIKLLEAGQ